MTITNSSSSSSSSSSDVQAVETVTVVIDGVALQVPKGTLVIRAAEMLGIEIPRFCDHPLLEPVAACRACLVDVEGVPKPQPSCAQAVTDGMVVRTQLSSPIAKEAQEGVMEFLLLNHPLDCPVCDKGGECPLQNQAMSVGRAETRFDLEKRQFDKPINISAQVLLDRERCVSCARCTRFADQIAGDPMIDLLERGAQQQIGTAADQPFESYFSGNTVQICPVGALTSAAYRFRARPFDLVSVPTTCEHCASGCSLRTDYRRGEVTRRLAWDEPEVNEEWNCDKGRFAFPYTRTGRLKSPLIRENGELRPASWPEAIEVAAKGLSATRGRTGAAVLTGGRLTVEDAYAYAKFARAALATDHLDFRARETSDEEAQFLRAVVAGSPVHTTYASLEKAPIVLLVALEPEDESPILFLRLRKAAAAGTRIVSVGAVASKGLAKLRGTRIDALPGHEAAAIADLTDDVRELLAQPGAVILVGERIAGVVGGPSALVKLAASTGAALAWVPRRAGERGALDAGALAGLLPSGRPLSDPAARAEVASVWGIEASALPSTGLSGAALIEAIAGGHAGAVVVAGIDPADYDNAELVRTALDTAPFVVSLEQRHSDVTERADVVLPIAAVTEKSGTFLDWEGRARPFPQVFREALDMSDATVLGLIAEAMGIGIGAWDVTGLRRELGSIGVWSGARADAPNETAAAATVNQGSSSAVVSSWRQLLDVGTLQEGEPYLAATAREVAATLPAERLVELGSPATVTITGPNGSIELPAVAGDVAAGAVHLPMRSLGCSIYADLGVRPGELVTISAGGSA
jgi:NADH-quinone oxidoreductase subunit G